MSPDLTVICVFDLFYIKNGLTFQTALPCSEETKLRPNIILEYYIRGVSRVVRHSFEIKIVCGSLSYILLLYVIFFWFNECLNK